MKASDFDYVLPEHMIAQDPTALRDHSRLLIYDGANGATEIKHFYDIVDYLNSGDIIVLNKTRVMQARLYGIKQGTQTSIEVLLLKKCQDTVYEVLVKPLKRLKQGDKVDFACGVIGELVSKDNGCGVARMCFNDMPEVVGEIPLPPYINAKCNDPERYQTVYGSVAGSAAAPTAGLHWTPELIQKAKNKGIIFCEILLHVGVGTFRPVKCDNICDHKMHLECYEVSSEVAQIINSAKAQKHRVIAVGTTVVRTLESIYARHGKVIADIGETDIFIYPPFDFGIVDAIITNFHLPKSTLLMLVSAFAGREKVLELYELAKNNDFRFFSFGDAMFLC